MSFLSLVFSTFGLFFGWSLNIAYFFVIKLFILLKFSGQNTLQQRIEKLVIVGNADFIYPAKF